MTQDRPSPDALLNAPDAAGMIKLRNELQGLVTYTIPINLRVRRPPTSLSLGSGSPRTHLAAPNDGIALLLTFPWPQTGTPELAVRQLQVLKDSQVPPEAIYALAIGNEPNLYK